jgi:hypothetical protein
VWRFFFVKQESLTLNVSGRSLNSRRCMESNSILWHDNFKSQNLSASDAMNDMETKAAVAKQLAGKMLAPL